MPRWYSIAVSIERSGALSIVTREDVDPGHQMECRYVVFDREPLSVSIREVHAGHVISDDSRSGTLADVSASQRSDDLTRGCRLIVMRTGRCVN
jgi:hypothetical protein